VVSGRDGARAWRATVRRRATTGSHSDDSTDGDPRCPAHCCRHFPPTYPQGVTDPGKIRVFGLVTPSGRPASGGHDRVVQVPCWREMVQARSNRVAVRLPGRKLRRDRPFEASFPSGRPPPPPTALPPPVPGRPRRVRAGPALCCGKVRLSGSTGRRPARKAKMQAIGCRFACPLA